MPGITSMVLASQLGLRNGGCDGSAGIRAMCPILNSLAYMSFKGMGNKRHFLY